jgi:hypothetical protein
VTGARHARNLGVGRGSLEAARSAAHRHAHVAIASGGEIKTSTQSHIFSHSKAQKIKKELL